MDTRAFQQCAVTLRAGCSQLTAGEQGAQQQPVLSYFFAGIAGREMPLDDPQEENFVARFASAVCNLFLRKGNRNGQGTGSLIGPRLVLTAGHVGQSTPGVAAFHFRPRCFRKLVGVAKVVQRVYRLRRGLDFATVRLSCHPAFGTPGGAFGVLYLRLWSMNDRQTGVLLGHVAGDLLRVFIRDVQDPQVHCHRQSEGLPQDCIRYSMDENAARSSSSGGWSGASGGPLLDRDGAIRGILKRAENQSVHVQRIDAIARESPEVRKAVRDQAPTVQYSMFPAQFVAPSDPRDDDWSPELTYQQWGRVASTSIPWQEGETSPRSGWSVFYVETQSGHLMNLRTYSDEAQLIPEVVHQDVSVLTGVCSVGRAGILGAWHSLHERNGKPRVHVLFSVAPHGLQDARGEVWHAWQPPGGHWQSERVTSSADLRAPSAVAYRPIEKTFTVQRRGGTEHSRNTVYEPRVIISTAGGWVELLTWNATTERWSQQRLFQAGAHPRSRIEALTAWWSTSSDRAESGLAVIAVIFNAPGSRLLRRVFVGEGGHVFPVSGLTLPHWATPAARTMSLSGTETAGGGRFVWHYQGKDRSGQLDRNPTAWIFDRNGRNGWTPSNLDNEARRAIAEFPAARMRLEGDHIWVAQGDGDLGHLFKIRERWVYSRINTYSPEAPPEAEESSESARADVAPVFLSDGGRQVEHGTRVESGSLLFVSNTGLLWSAFPANGEAPWLRPRGQRPLRGRGEPVRLRCVSGAAGLPLGWSYTPQGGARPLAPGEHPGTFGEGAWDALDECGERVERAACTSSCGCANRDTAFGFSNPLPSELAFGVSALEPVRQATTAAAVTRSVHAHERPASIGEAGRSPIVVSTRGHRDTASSFRKQRDANGTARGGDAASCCGHAGTASHTCDECRETAAKPTRPRNVGSTARAGETNNRTAYSPPRGAGSKPVSVAHPSRCVAHRAESLAHRVSPIQSQPPADSTMKVERRDERPLSDSLSQRTCAEGNR
jgi:hypothetical protein